MTPVMVLFSRHIYLAVVFSLVLLVMSIITGFIVQLFEPDMIALIIGDYQRVELLRHYRGSSLDNLLLMDLSERLDQWLFYSVNNIGIGVKTFIAGLLAGVGALVLMSYYGFSLGTQFGYLYQHEVLVNAWPLILPHSSLELGALALSSGAGFSWGAILFRRLMKRQSTPDLGIRKHLMVLLTGMLMFALAGAIESFVSSSLVIATDIKMAIGLVFWCVLVGWLIYIGNFFENR